MAKLADRLQLTPSARDRAGLMQAMTKSTQADIVSKTMKGYEEFKRLTNAKNEKG